MIASKPPIPPLVICTMPRRPLRQFAPRPRGHLDLTERWLREAIDAYPGASRENERRTFMLMLSGAIPRLKCAEKRSRCSARG